MQSSLVRGSFTSRSSFSWRSGLLGLTLTLAATGAHAAPGLSFSATRLDYGNQLIGRRSAAQTLKITNSGSSVLTIYSISFSGADPGDFVIGSDSGEGTLAVGASRTVGLQFRPLTAGPRGAVLAVSDNAAGSPQLMTLSGSGVTTYVNRSPSGLDFGTVTVGQASPWQTVTIRNDGNTPLGLGEINTGYTDWRRWFWVDTSSVPNTVLPPGGSCTIAVSFHPEGATSYSATLYMHDNAPFSPHTLLLTGTGVLPASPPRAPSNLSVRLLIEGPYLQFSWTDNSDNETGFQVAWRTGGQPWSPDSPYPTVGPNVTTWKSPQKRSFLGQPWEARVRAINQVGASAWSPVLSFAFPGPIPAPAVHLATSSTVVSLDWSDGYPAVSYTVSRATWVSGAQGWSPRVTLATVPSGVHDYTDRGVPPGRYFYWVQATRNASPLNTVPIYAGGLSQPDGGTVTMAGTAPLAPISLTAQYGSQTELNLAWRDVFQAADHFELQRRAFSAGLWATIATIPGGSSSYRDTGLTPLTTYLYRIRSINAVGVSPWSLEAAADTANPPAAPTGLAATALSARQTVLTWADHSNNETAIEVYRRSAGGAFSRIAVLAPRSARFTDSGLTPRTTYTYRVRATRNEGASSFTNDADVTTPAGP